MLAGFDDAPAFVAQAVQLVRAPAQVARLRQQARQAATALAWPQVVAEMEALFIGVLQVEDRRVQGLALA